MKIKVLMTAVLAVSIVSLMAAADSCSQSFRTRQVQFDLYQVPMPVPSEPKFIDVIMLDLEKTEDYLGAGHPEQPSLFLFIPCGERIAANPCGPKGRAPDRFGGIGVEK